LPEGHEHVSLPASQRQRKKINHLCALCGSAVKCVPSILIGLRLGEAKRSETPCDAVEIASSLGSSQ
jgi:hypothetical protein